MKTGVGLALIAVGAILAFAVTTNTSVFNLHTAGWVLIIIGLRGLHITGAAQVSGLPPESARQSRVLA